MDNKKLKRFILDGLLGILFLIIYEIIILIFSKQLNLFTLILGWAPFYFSEILFENIFSIIFSTLILFFIIGGLIGLLIRKIKRLF